MATRLLSPILNQAGQIASMSSPIPYLGPAFQLTAALIDLCQNVSKNRNAARELAYRCEGLVKTVEEDTVGRDPVSIQPMIDELLALLTDVKRQMTEWGSINWVRGFVKQATIADDIKKYHEEIDRYCQRFMVKCFRESFDWRIRFEEQIKADHQELLRYLADESKAQEFADKTQQKLVQGIRDDVKDLAALIQQQMLESQADTNERKGLEANFSALICSSREFPPVCELTPDLVRRTSTQPVGGGETFEIWRGICYNRIEVALKFWRHVKIDHRTKQRFDRQYRLWKAVYEKDRGKRILPLLGVVYQTWPEPTIILCSKWMEKGTAIKYVKGTDSAYRKYLIREIAEGIAFLHTFEPPLMHGEIQGSNILINEFGEPLLADFGLMRVVNESSTIDETSMGQTKELVRWCPLEMICEDQQDVTKVQVTLKSDITMWAMTVLELMTEQKPFSHLKPVLVILQRRAGLKPARPGPDVTARGLDDQLWGLMERCWSDDPNSRPSIQEVLKELS